MSSRKTPRFSQSSTTDNRSTLPGNGFQTDRITEIRKSPHPSPGVQLRGGNRQIRTTPPPLARGVTPVIAGSGGSYLDVSRDEMSQTFIVLSALPSP